MSEQFNLNNRYQFMGLIGKGHFGDVYRAADNFFRRDVALKMLRKESVPPEFLQYFSMRYAQQVAALGKLSNPSIIKTYDFTTLNGVPAWTMDLYSGTSFNQYAGTKLPVEQAANMLIPVADALTYAHQYGMIHGNLKPTNILLDSNQNPVLTDFGLAQWLSENRQGYGQFEANAGIGSPEYLAPEQGQGMMADQRTDVYTLGIIFYEMITGRKPFSAMSPMETMTRQISDQLPSPRYFVPNISQQAEQFLYQATAKNPSQRISSMSEAAMMLRGISTPSAPGSAYYPPASYYNTAAPNEDDDDDDDESLGDKLKAAAGNFRNNKSLLYAVIAIIFVLIAGIVLLVVSNNNKQIEAMNAAATQEAVSIAGTQEAVMAMIEGQRQQTQEAEQMIAQQTQEAIEAEAAAAAAAAAAVPTPEPIQIPTSPMAAPTAIATANGRFQSQTPADNSNFIMGEAFTVTWNMENTGSTNWSYNFKLVFDGGTNFTVGQITEKITEAEIWPGGAAGISLPCIAPQYPGTYSMNWHVEDANGATVFSPLTITINAIEGVLTPTPGPTPDGYIAPTLPSDIYIAN
ncbi:MAG: protein kinase [Flexilinea sp.]|nr:protein kinase [Flexilinea sp.]